MRVGGFGVGVGGGFGVGGGGGGGAGVLIVGKCQTLDIQVCVYGWGLASAHGWISLK